MECKTNTKCSLLDILLIWLLSSKQNSIEKVCMKYLNQKHTYTHKESEPCCSIFFYSTIKIFSWALKAKKRWLFSLFDSYQTSKQNSIKKGYMKYTSQKHTYTHKESQPCSSIFFYNWLFSLSIKLMPLKFLSDLKVETNCKFKCLIPIS